MEQSLTKPQKVYFWAIILLGIAVLLNFLQGWQNLPWFDILLFFALTLILLFKPLTILDFSTIYAHYWLDDIIIYAVIFIYGTKIAVIVVALSFTIFELYRLIKAKIIKGKLDFTWALPNLSRPSRFILITALSGITYELINQNTLLFSEPRNIIAIFTCAVVRFMLESFELSFSTHFIYKQPILTIWRKYFLTIFIQLLMMTPLGAILALLYQNESWAIILITAPTIALYYSLHSYQKTIDEVEKTFEALAHIIDEKDHYTSGHSERVAKFGKVIALELNLGDIRAQEIEKAGRIHDLGKINIPDKILQKKGALNPEETLLIQTHPSLILQLFYKYDRLKKYLPVKMASLHHERYDGLGYPYGLREKEIPIGARILAVADTFDALTSDRPYRKRLTEEEALHEIKKNQGTQFDPLIVEAILKAYQKGIVKSIISKWHIKEKAYFKKQKSQEIFEKLKNSIEK